MKPFLIIARVSHHGMQFSRSVGYQRLLLVLDLFLFQRQNLIPRNLLSKRYTGVGRSSFLQRHGFRHVFFQQCLWPYCCLLPAK